MNATEGREKNIHKKRKTPKWVIAYFALAIFDVVTVISSLYLNKEIIDIYHETSVENRKWAGYQEGLANLSELALLANTPGNDVFETKKCRERKEKI